MEDPLNVGILPQHIRRHDPEELDLNLHGRQNHKSLLVLFQCNVISALLIDLTKKQTMKVCRRVEVLLHALRIPDNLLYACFSKYCYVFETCVKCLGTTTRSACSTSKIDSNSSI
jgi:hypothetical protein